MKRTSKKFSPSKWMERLVPVLLGLILLGLVITLLVVALSVAGLTPTF